MSLLEKCACYILMYSGKRATRKQIDNLIKIAGLNVVRMARERGYEVQP